MGTKWISNILCITHINSTIIYLYTIEYTYFRYYLQDKAKLVTGKRMLVKFQ